MPDLTTPNPPISGPPGQLPEGANPVNLITPRLPDRGPRYKETPADPYAPTAPQIAEPYNTVTAAMFILIAVVWLVRLRGQFRRFPFLVASLPILLVGGIGGTLYHATRTRLTYFLLDLLPIQLLGFAASVYLLVRLGRVYGARKVFVLFFGLLAVYFFVHGVVFRMSGLMDRYPTLVVNLSYASLALAILTPIFFVLLLTRFRYVRWIALALSSFAVAWFCRLVDPYTDLPMGTHWLWHTFGAISTAAMLEYFSKIEGRSFSEIAQALPPDNADIGRPAVAPQATL